MVEPLRFARAIGEHRGLDAEGRPSDSMLETMGKSLARGAASSVGRQLVRGALGSLFGGRSRRSSW